MLQWNGCNVLSENTYIKEEGFDCYLIAAVGVETSMDLSVSTFPDLCYLWVIGEFGLTKLYVFSNVIFAFVMSLLCQVTWNSECKQIFIDFSCQSTLVCVYDSITPIVTLDSELSAVKSTIVSVNYCRLVMLLLLVQERLSRTSCILVRALVSSVSLHYLRSSHCTLIKRPRKLVNIRVGLIILLHSLFHNGFDLFLRIVVHEALFNFLVASSTQLALLILHPNESRAWSVIGRVALECLNRLLGSNTSDGLVVYLSGFHLSALSDTFT